MKQKPIAGAVQNQWGDNREMFAIRYFYGFSILMFILFLMLLWFSSLPRIPVGFGCCYAVVVFLATVKGHVNYRKK
ncbi:hypothetical protein IMZ31_23375 (plasmid) [Pontibacillus sp. ALD_SL1]|uniref:hypothetical protein n=1 Tax=Pontibacillus sp. ALD_SL1 TaxID=2777185 RepID=UPI001A962CCF|nr:hypothetical protein [Pontibacillus sp. ALD_SL1]QST02394.1 hypothetical protein IMZ31_23375 [Pontibacillus sp. ALD_SL1]